MVSAGTARDREPVDRGADEHEALGVDRLAHARLHVRAEREARQRDGQAVTVREPRPRVGEGRQRVVGLAAPFVERAVGRAHAAEIEPHRGVAQREERLRQRLRDLVVERPALQRMRMRDQRDARAAATGGRLSTTSSAPAGPGIV